MPTINLTPQEQCEFDGGTWDSRSNTCVPSRWRPTDDTKAECEEKGGIWIEGEGCSSVPMPEPDKPMEAFTDYVKVKSLMDVLTSKKLVKIFDLKINGKSLDFMLRNPPDDVFPKLSSNIYIQMSRLHNIPIVGTFFELMHALSFRVACAPAMPINIVGGIIANVLQWMIESGKFKVGEIDIPFTDKDIGGQEINLIPGFVGRLLKFLQNLVTLDVYEIYLMSLLIFGIISVLLAILAFKVSPEAIPILGNVAKIILRLINKILGMFGMVLK